MQTLGLQFGPIPFLPLLLLFGEMPPRTDDALKQPDTHKSVLTHRTLISLHMHTKLPVYMALDGGFLKKGAPQNHPWSLKNPQKPKNPAMQIPILQAAPFTKKPQVPLLCTSS